MIKIAFQGRNLKLRANIRDKIDQSIWAEIFKIKEYRIAEPTICSAKYSIIDVGAHIGFFILYARDLNPTVDIYALEPEPKNFLALKNNLNLNKFKKITVINSALSDQSGEATLLMAVDNHNHRLVKNYNQNQNTFTIPTISLSDLIKKYKLKKISLLKMDIEGWEYMIFKNLDSKVLSKISAIIMEYHNNRENNYREIAIFLRENGFGVQIFPSKFDKTLGFLFANNKRLR